MGALADRRPQRALHDWPNVCRQAPPEQPATLIILLPFAMKMLGKLFYRKAVMASTKVSETLIRREVERLFGEISAKRGDLCENPVTGGEFVYGFDPIRLQKKIAYHALRAREDFALNGPADAPRLPLEHWECERVRWSGRPLGLPHRTICEIRGSSIQRQSASIF